MSEWQIDFSIYSMGNRVISKQGVTQSFHCWSENNERQQLPNKGTDIFQAINVRSDVLRECNETYAQSTKEWLQARVMARRSQRDDKVFMQGMARAFNYGIQTFAKEDNMGASYVHLFVCVVLRIEPKVFALRYIPADIFLRQYLPKLLNFPAWTSPASIFWFSHYVCITYIF